MDKARVFAIAAALLALTSGVSAAVRTRDAGSFSAWRAQAPTSTRS